jgi:hypothetical protein
MLFSKCNFHENIWSKAYTTLPNDVNKILAVLRKLLIRLGQNFVRETFARIYYVV